MCLPTSGTGVSGGNGTVAGFTSPKRELACRSRGSNRGNRPKELILAHQISEGDGAGHSTCRTTVTGPPIITSMIPLGELRQ